MIREARAEDAGALQRLYGLLVPGNPRIRVLPERLRGDTSNFSPAVRRARTWRRRQPLRVMGVQGA